MNHVEILKAARKLLSDPAKWTKGTLCRDEEGEPAPFEEATCFCSIGACFSFDSNGMNSYDTPFNIAVEYLDAAGAQWIADFNDRPGRTHKQVLARFDRAIATAEAHALEWAMTGAPVSEFHAGK